MSLIVLRAASSFTVVLYSYASCIVLHSPALSCIVMYSSVQFFAVMYNPCESCIVLNMLHKTLKISSRQAGAELGQAQLKLGLEFNLINSN